MQVHARAPLSPIGRRRVVDRVIVEGWSVTAAAEAAAVCERTLFRWLARFREFGQAGLVDRAPIAHRQPTKTPPQREQLIAALRRLHMTAAEIAELLTMPLSTVSAVLKRLGLGKRSKLEPVEPVNRYERRHPGELVHVDVKKLGRIGPNGAGHRVTGSKRGQANRGSDGKRTAGWEFVHVCVDDATRLAYVEVLDDERGETCAAFLRRAVAWLAGHGVSVERVMSDNGAGYRSAVHAATCRQLGVRHLRTRPYRPRTNGKAERFIQTLTRSWAYGRIFGSSAERTSALDAWLDHYNFTRPHGALGHQPPATRLTKAPRNNS